MVCELYLNKAIFLSSMRRQLKSSLKVPTSGDICAKCMFGRSLTL